MSRERIIYYINVGNLSKKRAQQHVKKSLKVARGAFGKKPKIFGLAIRNGDSVLKRF